MGNGRNLRAAIVGLLLVVAAALAGCGSSAETKTVVVTQAAPAPSLTKAPEQSKPRKAWTRAAKPKRSLVACDAQIRARKPGTTCSFAENVFYGYWMNDNDPGAFADSAGIPAYSKAAAKMFYVNCSGTSKIVCRADDGGYVTFPAAAVSAYTLENAKRYAATHDLGDVPAPTDPGDQPEDPTGPPPSDQTSDCDPNYEGACLDPNSFDYDCEGGSGDGPDYTGTVTVVGDDHYGLDRDGDGTACDS